MFINFLCCCMYKIAYGMRHVTINFFFVMLEPSMHQSGLDYYLKKKIFSLMFYYDGLYYDI